MITMQNFVAVAGMLTEILRPFQNKPLRLSLFGEKGFYKGEEEVTHEISGSTTREIVMRLRQLYVYREQLYHQGQPYAIEGEFGGKAILVPFWLMWINQVQDGWYGFFEDYTLTRITDDISEKILVDKQLIKVGGISMITGEIATPRDCWNDAFLKPFHIGTEKRVPDWNPSFFFLEEPYSMEKLLAVATPRL